MEKCSQHGKRCSQHGKSVRNMEKVFATSEKVFATFTTFAIASQHHDPTTDIFSDSNRVARKMSDASAQIGRPDASSSELQIATS
jgi:hypothetical protein